MDVADWRAVDVSGTEAAAGRKGGCRWHVVSVKTQHERGMLLLEEDGGFLKSCFRRGCRCWHALGVQHLGSSRLRAEGWLVCKVVDLHGHAGGSRSKVTLIPVL